MPLPFQTKQANAPQTGPAPAPQNLFARAASAELFDSTPAKPNHGTYIVHIDKILNKDGKAVITEYTIQAVQAPHPSEAPSPVGTKSSSYQGITNKESWSYLSKQVLAQLGVAHDSPDASGAQFYIPAILSSETTGQPSTADDGTVIQPGSLSGRLAGLVLSPNLNPDGSKKLGKGGKYYPREDWFPVAG
jgi:hypothetical protein